MDLYRISVEILLDDDHDKRADQIIAAREPRKKFAEMLVAAGIDAEVVAQIVPEQPDAPVVRRGRKPRVVAVAA